jgi:hypothetical protein
VQAAVTDNMTSGFISIGGQFHLQKGPAQQHSSPHEIQPGMPASLDSLTKLLGLRRPCVVQVKLTSCHLMSPSRQADTAETTRVLPFRGHHIEHRFGAGYAGYTLFEADTAVLSTEIEINLLNPAGRG